MPKIIHVSGKRKSSIARATLKPGTGKVRINNELVDIYGSELLRLRLTEPLILAGDVASGVDIIVRVRGG